MVCEHVAVKMGQLVLDHAAGEAVEAFRYFFQGFVVVFYGHGVRAADVGIYAGNAQAAFVEGAHVVTLGDYPGVDKSAAEVFQVVVDVCHFCSVYDYDPLGYAYLRRGQAAAFCNGKGVLEVLDQGFDGLCVLKVYFFRLLPKDF